MGPPRSQHGGLHPAPCTQTVRVLIYINSIRGAGGGRPDLNMVAYILSGTQMVGVLIYINSIRGAGGGRPDLNMVAYILSGTQMVGVLIYINSIRGAGGTAPISTWWSTSCQVPRR